MLSRSAYRELLAIARVHARGAIEAEDLLQEAGCIPMDLQLSLG